MVPVSLHRAQPEVEQRWKDKTRESHGRSTDERQDEAELWQGHGREQHKRHDTRSEHNSLPAVTWPRRTKRNGIEFTNKFQPFTTPKCSTFDTAHLSTLPPLSPPPPPPFASKVLLAAIHSFLAEGCVI